MKNRTEIHIWTVIGACLVGRFLPEEEIAELDGGDP